ncbi:MAG: ABC transporter ATP-binding protein [Solirubrobacterales bacterium]|nr:ABC transporter ATP-binding protein [Solirubrobacterales bacterium]
MSVETRIAEAAASRERRELGSMPVVVEVRGVSKTFRVPDHRVDSLKERALHPLRRVHFRELHALRDVSFEVHRGEFFGIVGRNGSGKSTLLKILASIYRPDTGRVRLAGRLAPFIELGVGFNPELTSRENVALNGVLMGLSRQEARRRLDAVLDFAELREFADLKLKNFSSGMMVRLAFAVMVQADADVMLVDEVLAVGDASFSQKCVDTFGEMQRRGRTIVLVTHDMPTVQRFCDRALLIHDSEIQYLGEADETALRYYRINFGGDPDEVREPGTIPDVSARIVEAWLEDEYGRRIQNVEQGQRFSFHCLIEARRPLRKPIFSFQFLDFGGNEIFGFSKTLDAASDAEDVLPTGNRVLVGGEIENRLLPGRYHIGAWIVRNRTAGDLALHAMRLLEFTVYGTEQGPGSVQLSNDVRVVVLDPETKP